MTLSRFKPKERLLRYRVDDERRSKCKIANVHCDYNVCLCSHCLTPFFLLGCSGLPHP